MTPLAHMLQADACLPVNRRKFRGPVSEIGLLSGWHFFECTAVYKEALRLAGEIKNIPAGAMSRTAFLPASKTWLEIAGPSAIGVKRFAILCQQDDDNLCASIQMIFLDMDGSCHLSGAATMQVMLAGNEGFNKGVYYINPKAFHDGDESGATADLTCLIYALLAMVNTPRIVGRRQHQPHAGLQRAIARSRVAVGSFPLQAWTELKLEVHLPRDESKEDARQTILSGSRALHFVRRHIRIRRGQLEIVSPHWRGDPALGIKRTRYAVVPPKDGKWPQLTHHSEGVPE